MGTPGSTYRDFAYGYGQWGGDGMQSAITGTPTYYAGGGGAATGGLGGKGGGGRGYVNSTLTPGTNGLGGGAGGGSTGGSGVVIISYVSYGQTATAFTPTTVSGLFFWLDGADPAGTGVLPADGASVSTWVDKSTSGKNATSQATAALYSLSLKALRFSGSYYTTSYGTAPNSVTMFFVINIPANNYGDVMSGFMQVVNNGYRQHITINGGNTVVDGSISATPNTNVLWSITVGTSLTSYAYVNGAQSGSQGSGVYNGASGIAIGAYDTIHEMFSGYINEVLLYNSYLSEAQRQTVEGYLAWKWGIQSSLPGTHAYKYDSPY
jgi:hypothetical protein